MRGQAFSSSNWRGWRFRGLRLYQCAVGRRHRGWLRWFYRGYWSGHRFRREWKGICCLAGWLRLGYGSLLLEQLLRKLLAFKLLLLKIEDSGGQHGDLLGHFRRLLRIPLAAFFHYVGVDENKDR